MNHHKKPLAEQNWEHNTDLMSAKDLAALDAVMEAGFKFNLVPSPLLLDLKIPVPNYT